MWIVEWKSTGVGNVDDEGFAGRSLNGSFKVDFRFCLALGDVQLARWFQLARFAFDFTLIGEFDRVEYELVFASAEVLHLDAFRRNNRLAVEEEVGVGRQVGHFHFEDHLVPLDGVRVLQLLVELVYICACNQSFIRDHHLLKNWFVGWLVSWPPTTILTVDGDFSVGLIGVGGAGIFSSVGHPDFLEENASLFALRLDHHSATKQISLTVRHCSNWLGRLGWKLSHVVFRNAS